LIISDFVLALRRFRQSPVITATMLLSLAVGMGANIAIFGIIDRLLLRALPVPDPGRLVIVQTAAAGKRGLSLTYPDYLRLSQSNVLDGLAACSDVLLRSVRSQAGATRSNVAGELVSTNYYSVLGVQPQRGRAPSDSDSVGVLISKSLSSELFPGDQADGSGASLVIDGVQVIVLGTVPDDFVGDAPERAADIWIPITLQPQLMHQDWLRAPWIGWVRAIGRLKHGASMRQAQGSLERLYRSMHASGPVAGQSGVYLISGAFGFGDVRKRLERPLWLLMGAVGFLFLAACVNVAGLLLIRSVHRGPEMAVRVAIGASTKGLVRQVATEHALLAVAGAGLAVVVGQYVQRVLLLMIAGVAESFHVKLLFDIREVYLTVFLCLFAVVCFGCAPIVQVLFVNVGKTLARTHASASRNPTLVGLQRVLIGLQIALSLVLGVSSLVLLRSLEKLYLPDTSVSRDRVVIVSLPFDFSKASLHIRRYPALKEALERIPNVKAVSLATFGPLGSASQITYLSLPGTSSQANREQVSVNYISPSYFRTYGIGLVGGRDFSGRDGPNAEKVVALNQAAARLYFPDRPALGQKITLGASFDAANNAEVVAIVRDVRFENPRVPPAPEVFVPISQKRIPAFSIAIRVQRSGVEMAGDIRRAIAQADPDLRGYTVETYEEMLDHTLAEERTITKFSAVFALLVVGLTSIGVYGTVSYLITRRSFEFGVRMALGATVGNVVNLLVREICILFSVGLIVGGPVLLLAGRELRALVYGVAPLDSFSVIVTLICLACVVAVAGMLPVRRIVSIDPAATLRYE
jgi:macrolide transport system ATP-binding/permease protein